MFSEWLSALFGGVLIGFAVSIMLVLNGRVTGVSGIFSGVLFPEKQSNLWRVFFVAGLIVGGGILFGLCPDLFEAPADSSGFKIVLAGVLVGFGTLLGNGCTSGHGVCGIARLSPRSMSATLIFIGFGILTVFALRYLGWS